jgi:hypothetical protein
MIFAIMSMIYAGTILFFVGTTALILLAWARRRYADGSPNDLIYVAVSIILLVSAGINLCRFANRSGTRSFGMTILKQAAFSIAVAVLAVAVAEYVMWILEQNGGISL